MTLRREDRIDLSLLRLFFTFAKTTWKDADKTSKNRVDKYRVVENEHEEKVCSSKPTLIKTDFKEMSGFKHEVIPR